MSHQRRFIIPSILLSTLLLLSLLAMLTLQAFAQGDGGIKPTIDPNQWYVDSVADNKTWDLPFFEPGTSAGTADWTMKSSAFLSRYPRGFEFTASVESSGGDIVAASVIWSHAPNQLKRREATIEPDGNIYLRWYPEENLPPWIAVNYYWSLTDSAGNRWRSDWILGNEYEDNTSQWTRLESTDVIVVVQEGLPVETANLVIRAMADQEATFEAAWGGRLSYKPRVILFSVRDDFERWRGGFSGTIVGQTSDDWGATVQVITNDDIAQLTYGTVLHEIAHLYQFDFVPDGFPAGSWFTEGDATFFELAQEYDYEERVRTAASDGDLPILLNGFGPSTFSAGPDGQNRWAYDVGFTFWLWVALNYDLDAHRQIVEGLAAGEARDVVLERVLGMDIDEVERAWRLWLGDSADVPRLAPTPTYPSFPPTVTPFQYPTRSAE